MAHGPPAGRLTGGTRVPQLVGEWVAAVAGVGAGRRSRTAATPAPAERPAISPTRVRAAMTEPAAGSGPGIGQRGPVPPRP